MENPIVVCMSMIEYVNICSTQNDGFIPFVKLMKNKNDIVLFDQVEKTNFLTTKKQITSY